MLKIDNRRIDIYAKCPKKYEYYQDIKHLPNEKLLGTTALLKNITKKAYLNKARSGNYSPWRQLVGEVDKYCFKNVDMDDEDAVNIAYEKSVKLIKRLKRDWFDKFYRAEHFEGLPDLPCGVIFNDVMVYDTIDLVLYDNRNIYLVLFKNVAEPIINLYNSIRLRNQAYMLTNELGKPVTGMRQYVWNSSDKIYIQDMKIHRPDKFHDISRRALEHMANGIKNKAFYTSISEQCLTCPFNSKCSM